MSAAPRPQLKDARRKFWWGEHDLIDYGVIARVGTSAWAVYTCLLRHVNDEGSTFPSVPLLEAETGLSNRVIAQSIGRLKAGHLIEVDRLSHQWNTYIILDVVHAIRKNGWKRVEKKARDDSSPAQRGRSSTEKQVTNRHPNKNQLKKNQGERGAVDAGDAQAQSGLLSAPVVEPNPAQHSSSSDAALNDAARQTATHEAGSVMNSPADLALPHVPSSPALVLQELAPDGVAADAALDLDFSREEFDLLFGAPSSTEALEHVPGAAAGGRVVEALRGASLSPMTLSVAELLPIPAPELNSRPVAAPEGEVRKALREVVGNGLPRYLSEYTRTGQISRQLWLKLTLAEIQQVADIARLESGISNDNMITLAVRGLDRLIGAVKAPKPEGKPVPAGQKVIGPVDLSHLDPHLPEGGRCTVDGKLGVVKSVRQNGYIVEFDSGDMATVDRFVAAHLSSLKASTEPHVAAASSDEVVVLAKVGSRYRELATEAEVHVTAVQGANRVLSSGRTLACYELLNATRFERLAP